MRRHIQEFGLFNFYLGPPDPPGNIQYKSTKSGQLKFSWDPPACGQRHGDIKYEYKYWSQDTVSLKRINTSAPEALMTGLIKGDLYFFRVRAYNIEGPGPYSSTYNASTISTSHQNSISGHEKGKNLTSVWQHFE